jgi:serine/tyrosine/threonine adenylyltransferase
LAIAPGRRLASPVAEPGRNCALAPGEKGVYRRCMSALPPFLAIADTFADPVQSAAFPQAILRHRNQRAADSVGLGALSAAAWQAHFHRFEPLPGNLPQPLAMRYHGHQFGTYNPELGDGRGFLFAQVRDQAGRLLDLGTKGSGTTPWSRRGDGRLTLKGGVREILAATYLEALGVNTSKAFSLFETGEALSRNDEPSPTRGSVLVRLSHSHVRIGSFQRCAYLEDRDAMARLLDYCVAEFYPHAARADTAATAAAFLESVTRATAAMIGQWMAAGFVHGVMNTDNFNITGETFDFGPWRFLPVSDPNFTAAYFDEHGLYRFGRQPVQGAAALEHLASSLLLLCDSTPLVAALAPYGEAYRDSYIAHTHALLGLKPTGDAAADTAFLVALYGWMTERGAAWPEFFFDWFGGAMSEARAGESPQGAVYREPAFEPVRAGLLARTPDRPERLKHPYFQRLVPVNLLINTVEALWAPIATRDDWTEYARVMAEIETMREAVGFGGGA